MLINSKRKAIISCLLLRDEAVWLHQRNEVLRKVKDLESVFDCLISKRSGFYLIVLLIAINLGSLHGLDILHSLGVG